MASPVAKDKPVKIDTKAPGNSAGAKFKFTIYFNKSAVSPSELSWSNLTQEAATNMRSLIMAKPDGLCLIGTNDVVNRDHIVKVSIRGMK